MKLAGDKLNRCARALNGALEMQETLSNTKGQTNHSEVARSD